MTRLTGEHWKSAVGQAWADLAPVMERMYLPIGEAVAEAARVAPGMRVLDVGCGAGATTLALGRRVGPGGASVGADISATLLASARQAAKAGGLGQASFVEADAQTYGFDPHGFDAVVSRFGVMFFQDPDAAFANLRRAAKPDGRLAFAAWRSAAENPLALVPVEAARPFVEVAPSPPDAPGRWAFADPARVRAILDRSGWRDIDVAPLDVPTPISLEDFTRMNLRLGSLGPLLAEQPQAVVDKVREAVVASLQPYEADGVIDMDAACWLVTARG